MEVGGRFVQRILRNQRGDITVGAVFLILFLVILTVFLLTFINVQIQCANIRSKVRIELNNISALIASRTYDAMREGNLDEYVHQCNSGEYQQYLSMLFRVNLLKSLPKKTKDYTINNESVNVSYEAGRIIITYRCNIKFQVAMYGTQYTVYNRPITVEGYHNTKF